MHRLANNREPQDYGPLVILRHAAGDGTPFFTLYGHLTEETLAGLQVGQAVARGQAIGHVGSPPGNGDWPPHLHFQLILDLLELDEGFPGVALAEPAAPLRGALAGPEPAAAHPDRTSPARSRPRTRRSRAAGASWDRACASPTSGRSRSCAASGSTCSTTTGRAYLDVYNNVPLVGHGHPRVVRAMQEQLALLNTNTRYLHDLLVSYARRLTRLLPEPLRVCFFVNSGSEANELALRLARAATGGSDVIVLEHAYHGHTTTLVDVSPYKFLGPGGSGKRDFVHVAPLPDPYRGRYRRDDPRAGPKYAQELGKVASGLAAGGRRLAAFLSETLPSVGGPDRLPARLSRRRLPPRARGRRRLRSRTRCRPASGGSARHSGASRRRTWCPTSSCSASRSRTASRSERS